VRRLQVLGYTVALAPTSFFGVMRPVYQPLQPRLEWLRTGPTMWDDPFAHRPMIAMLLPILPVVVNDVLAHSVSLWERE
jgi:hypothetical protein